MRIQVTHELCSGCRLCQLACSLRLFGENNPRKSAILIRSNLLEDGRYRVAVCDQCGICEEVCPAGAIDAKEGVYIVDPAECVWCMVCAEECPQGALLGIPEERTPVKCISCGDCVEICPTGALAMVE